MARSKTIDTKMIEAPKTKKEETKINLEGIKEELTLYIDKEIRRSFNDSVEKSNKRLIHEKNKKIIVRDIIIVLLAGVIAFLMYIMYRNNYFDRFFNHNVIKEETIIKSNDTNEDTKVKEEVKTPSLEELKKKYAHLLDNYVISSSSSYKKDFYNGNLTLELRKYMALNTLDFSDIKVEDDYNIISENVLRKAYDKLFDNDYSLGNFDFNGNKIRYISGADIYMSTDLLKLDNDIKREITSILEDDDIYITTIEYIIMDNKLYNVSTMEEVMEYQNDAITSYKDKLNTITYRFHNDKLESVKVA